MELSYWEYEYLYNPDKIVIIGAGIVGLCTAIYTKVNNPDQEIIIFERGMETAGASTKNAGFACFGSATEILSDFEYSGESEVYNLVKKRYQGLQRLLTLVDKQEIDYLNLGGYEVFRKGDFIPADSDLKGLNDSLQDVLDLDHVYQRVTDTHKMTVSQSMIFNQYEGQLNPYKLIQELKRKAISLGVRIYYQMEVQQVIQSDQCLQLAVFDVIPYHKLVLCTNGFSRRLFPELKVFPARNQVLITKPIENLSLQGTYHCDQGYLYFRNYNDRVLLGGGRNKDQKREETDEFGLTSTIQSYLLDFLHNYLFPGRRVEVDRWWSGIMGVGHSKETIIRYLGNEIYSGVRLGGMGIAIGSEVGFELSNLINS